MKKITTLFLFMCLSFVSIAQTVTTTISGTIINTATGASVSNQPVYISADTTSSTFSYYNVVYTDTSGYYVDTLTIPSPSQIIFHISTSNCNGGLVTNMVVSSTLPMVSYFTINCGGNPTTCDAAFNVFPDSANNYLYYFIDASVAGSGSITSWAWDFGDGGTSTLQNPTHTFSAMGLYTVCLTISSDSCTDTYCDSMFVDSANTPVCYASFQYGITGTTASFYGFANDSTVNYSWEFGDATTGTGQNISHTYLSDGVYNVCLTIHNSNGCFDQYCETVTIGNSSNGCPASFYAYPDSMAGSFTYNFTNTSPGSNTGGIYYFWSFGDGTGSNDINPVHTFTGFGTYTICLHVMDDSTGVTLCSYCNTIVIDTSGSTGCYANFGWNVTSAASVYFYDYSGTSGPIDAITSWTWDFGDGSFSTDQNPIHVFGSGLYNVCLAITTASGCSSTYCDYIQTSNLDSTYCDLYVLANTITYESAFGTADGSIDIDVYGGTPPYSYLWNTGQMSQDLTNLTAGYYEVTVTDNSGLPGCQTWATFEILNQADSSNWVFIDTLYAGAIDSCFNFSIGAANIYSWTFIDNTTIEITWIIYDTQGVSHGFVTTVYALGASGNYQFTVTIICGGSKNIHVFYDDLFIINSAGLAFIYPVTEGISLFPNPVTDVLNIEMKNVSGNVKVMMSNAAGQVICTMNTNQKTISVNTSFLPKGMYFIQVISDGQMMNSKFVK